MKLNQVYRRRLSLRLSIYLCLPAILTIALASLHWMPTGKASTPEPNHTQDITPAAIPNDTCATATVITPASLPFGIDAATDAAVNDIDPGLLGCVQGPGRDAVYSFIPATTGVYTVGATPTGIGFDISLYLVTDCANPATTCVAGANIDPLGKGESVSPTLTAGTRYFIVVDGATADTFGGFHLSLRSGLPSNDTCATPTLIEASRLPFSETASTFGANDDLNPDEPCLRTRQSGTGPEVIYQFTPADSQNYRLTVTPMGLYDTSIYIVTNCGSLVGCTSADFQGAGGAEFIQRNLTAGTTYFIVVDGFGGDSGDFSIFFEPSIPLAPNAPSNLVATALSGAEIRLNWDDNSSNELGFRIERSLDGFAFNEIATTEPNAEVFNDTTVAANTTYFYRVLAFNNFGNSAPSNVAGATTPEPPPPPVPVIAVSPNPLDFGSVRTSLTLTVTVSNNGGSDLVITAITDPAAPFSIVDKPAVPLTIAPAGSRELMVRFSPNAAQLFTGNFTIQSNDNTNPFAVVNLRGVGTALPVPNLQISNVIINFPSGSSSTAVEVRNSGDADLLISSLSNPAAPFSAGGAPPFPATFRPGEGFVLTVAFSPAQPGVFNAEMLLVCNDPDQLITVLRLRGTSTPQDEQFKLRAPTSFTAVAGQANTLNVLAANGTNTDITLTASSVPGGVFTDRRNGRGDLVITPAASATGSLLVTFTARDGQNRQKSIIGSITIVAAADSHRAQLIWTAPGSGADAAPTSLFANDLSITPLSSEASIESEFIEPEQTTGLIGYLIFRSTSPAVPRTLANVAGIALAGQTSFTDNVPSPAGSPQAYHYVVSAFYGTGNESVGSNESSTAPRMINLQFRKKGFRMQAANSNIAVGATFVVDGTQSFALTRNGDLIIVHKTALSTPGGMKPNRVVPAGSTHTVQVRNPNGGAVSVIQSFTR